MPQTSEISDQITNNNRNSQCHDWCNIVLSIQKPLSNKFFKYLAEWNATKMKYNGKGETKWISSMSTIFYRKLWSYTYLFSGTTGSKLIHHGKVLLQNLNFYMVYVGGSEASGINRRKYYIYSGIDY